MASIKRPTGRPSSIEAALVEWGVAVAEGMALEQEARDFVATGDSLASYQVVIAKPNHIELLVAGYVRFSVSGRPPGGFPPISAIAEWIEVKGIQSPGITVNSLAFLIARKIANEGNAVWRGDREGIPLQEIIEDSFYPVMSVEATKIAIAASNYILKSMQPKVKRI